jgi:hypothetical protein
MLIQFGGMKLQIKKINVMTEIKKSFTININNAIYNGFGTLFHIYY